MYKPISMILSLVLILPLAACSGAADPIDFAGEIGGEITISAYDTMLSKSFLEDAARLFEETYPGTTVTVKTFSVMPEIRTSGQDGMIMAEMQDHSQGLSDYLNQVNTALMSGKGADILAMDVLPVQKYVDSGHLANLDTYMDTDPDFNRGDYQENILDAARYKGGTWFLPMNYTFDYYAYDTTLLPGESGFGTDRAFTLEQLMDLAEGSFDGSAMMFNISDYNKRSGGMWGKLFTESYHSFVDLENKTANFDNGSFAALLESVRQYSEQGYIAKGAASQAGAGEGETGRFYFKSQNVINLISLFTRDLGIKMTGMAEGGTMAIGDDDEIAGIAAAADGSVPFTCEQAYGISASSQNKETAWAFLKFLLSEEMQINANIRPTALPIANSAREKKMELMLTSLMEQQGQSLSEAQLAAIARYNEAVKQLSGQINTYIFEDTIINDMVVAEVQYFFEGTKTAGEAADILQSKVDLYLNE